MRLIRLKSRRSSRTASGLSRQITALNIWLKCSRNAEGVRDPRSLGRSYARNLPYQRPMRSQSCSFGALKAFTPEGVRANLPARPWIYPERAVAVREGDGFEIDLASNGEIEHGEDSVLGLRRGNDLDGSSAPGCLISMSCAGLRAHQGRRPGSSRCGPSARCRGGSWRPPQLRLSRSLARAALRVGSASSRFRAPHKSGRPWGR